MKQVPTLPSDAFAKAFNTALAVQHGKQQLKNKEASEAVFQQIDDASQGKATELQKIHAAVGYEVFHKKQEYVAYIARVEALMDLLSDENLTKTWAAKDWVKYRPDPSGAISAATFILWAAARCPMTEHDAGFSQVKFEELATKMQKSLR